MFVAEVASISDTALQYFRSDQVLGPRFYRAVPPGTCVLFLYFGTVLATPLAGKIIGCDAPLAAADKLMGLVSLSELH